MGVPVTPSKVRTVAFLWGITQTERRYSGAWRTSTHSPALLPPSPACIPTLGAQGRELRLCSGQPQQATGFRRRPCPGSGPVDRPVAGFLHPFCPCPVRLPLSLLSPLYRWW